jgi:hypothetical protein
MDDEQRWLDSLATYEGLEMGRRKVELNSIIRPALERLQRDAPTLEALRELYHAGDDWWLAIARDGYPDQPRMWEKARTADVAYGMRYKQLIGEAPRRPS